MIDDEDEVLPRGKWTGVFLVESPLRPPGHFNHLNSGDDCLYIDSSRTCLAMVNLSLMSKRNPKELLKKELND